MRDLATQPTSDEMLDFYTTLAATRQERIKELENLAITLAIALDRAIDATTRRDRAGARVRATGALAAYRELLA